MSTHLVEVPTKEIELTPRGWVSKYGLPRAGWACILRYQKHFKSIRGSAVSQSERRMEVMAVVHGLKTLKVPCRVNLYIGTEYVADGARQLIRGLRSSSFVASVVSGTAKNADLWQQFYELARKHRVQVIWVSVRGDRADDSRARFAARWAA